MFVHVVLMRFDDKAVAEEAVRRLQFLADIDVVRRLTVGLNVVPHPAAFELGLVVEFDRREDLDVYEADPAHRAVAAFIVERRSAAARCDYPA